MRNPIELREEAGWYLRAAKNACDLQLKQQMAVRALELSELADALSRAADDGSPETTCQRGIGVIQATSSDG
jgi:hypothetical protein